MLSKKTKITLEEAKLINMLAQLEGTKIEKKGDEIRVHGIFSIKEQDLK